MKGFVDFAAAAAALTLVDQTTYWVAGNASFADGDEGWFAYDASGVGAGSSDVIVVTHGGRLRRLTKGQGDYYDQLKAALQTLPSGTDRSSSITTGSTAQTLAAANASRIGLTGQNISTGDLWINEIGGTAAADTAGSFKVPADGTFEISTNRAISIVGATTGQKFTATEY